MTTKRMAILLSLIVLSSYQTKTNEEYEIQQEQGNVPVVCQEDCPADRLCNFLSDPDVTTSQKISGIVFLALGYDLDNERTSTRVKPLAEIIQRAQAENKTSLILPIAGPVVEEEIRKRSEVSEDGEIIIDKNKMRQELEKLFAAISKLRNDTATREIGTISIVAVILVKLEQLACEIGIKFGITIEPRNTEIIENNTEIEDNNPEAE